VEATGKLTYPAFQVSTCGGNATDPRADLDLLNSHRLSHVAETGQLMPRIRIRPGNSGEWATMADLSRPSDLLAPTTARTPSPTIAQPSYENPFATPLMSRSTSPTTPSASPIFSPPDFTPATNTLPTMRQDYSTEVQAKSARDIGMNRQCWQVEHAIINRDQLSVATAGSQPVLTAQNYKRASEVMRKVNSGFEILRPGTLNVISQSQIVQERDKQEKRPSKKLQKKRLFQSLVL
jgi:hypothetical protein